MTQIAVYYDTIHPSIYISGGGVGLVYPPLSLTALIDGNGEIEVWIGSIQRIIGPVPYGQITNGSGTTFSSASAALAYLNSQFSQAPSGGGGSSGSTVLDEFTATANGAMTKNYITSLPASVLIYINGIIQSASDYNVSGVTLTLTDALDILIGDVITVTT